MFIFSVKFKNIRIIASVAVLAVILFISVAICGGLAKSGTVNTVLSVDKLIVKTNKDRLEFLGQYGYKAEEDPININDVYIPTEFDEFYEKYNLLQKTQKFDLENYKGKLCKKYTYKLIDYPNNKKNMVANLLVYQNTIIGGDISSLEDENFTVKF